MSAIAAVFIAIIGFYTPDGVTSDGPKHKAAFLIESAGFYTPDGVTSVGPFSDWYTYVTGQMFLYA